MKRILTVASCVLCLGLAGVADNENLVRLTGEVMDAESLKPLPARIYIRGEDGVWHFPRSEAKEGSAVQYRVQRKNMLEEMHTTISAHPFIVDLPPGKYTITVERGKEYHPETRTVIIGKAPVQVTFKLKRWIEMAKRGWYSGETHVHRLLNDLPNLMLAEDLNVAFPLSYWVTEAFVPPRVGPRTSPDPGPKPIEVDRTHVIYPRNTEYEIFTVGKKPHPLGAFMIINHKKIFDRGAPPLRAIAEQAHAEDALIDLDKPNWPWSMLLIPLMNVDLFELANNHHWRVGFGYPGFGAAPADYMKIERDLNGLTEWGWTDFNWQNYYTLLNCGFRLRPTAGCASGVHPVPLGFGRVYVHLDAFSYDGWVKGLSAGRSFVSTGPILFVQVNGQAPGHIFKNAVENGYRVTGSAINALPLSKIEVVVNGQVREVIKPENRPTKEGAFESRIEADVKITGSSWLAIRCVEKRDDGRVRFAHTGPFHIEVPGKPLRPRRVETDYLVHRVEEQITRSKDVLPEPVLAEYREALQAYQKIAETAE